MAAAISGRDSAFSQLSFAVAMVAASSLGMMKTLFLAMTMAPEGFGQYATFFGLAVVGSILVSFGDVEGTSKFYPRLWVSGQFDAIRHDISITMRKLVVRCVIMSLLAGGALALSALFTADAAKHSLAIILTIILILPLSISLLLASAVRAAGSSSLLIGFTAFRGGSSLILVLLATFLLDWQYLLAAETIAAIIALFLFFPHFKKIMRKAQTNELAGQEEARPVEKSGGRYLYIANLVSSAVPYGGRAAINLLAGPAMAGAYAVLMIFVQMGQLLAGVISQRVGPQLIKWRMQGQHVSLKTVGFSLLIVFVASVAAFVMLAASLYINITAKFWQTYGIGIEELFLTCLAMCMSVYLILQFMLVSLDGEKEILIISMMVVIFCYFGFYFSSFIGLGLVGFMASAVLMDAFRIGAFVFDLNKRSSA